MKLAGLAALAAGLAFSAAGAAEAAVVYRLDGPGLSLEVTTPDFVQGTKFVPSISMDECQVTGGTCDLAVFFANPAGFDSIQLNYTRLPGYASASANYFFFGGSLQKTGSYVDIVNNSARLTVETTKAAVPEPAAWALMILGFGAAGSGLRRRRAAQA